MTLIIGISLIGGGLSPIIRKQFINCKMLKNITLENITIRKTKILVEQPTTKGYKDLVIYDYNLWTNKSNLDIKAISNFYPSTKYKFTESILKRDEILKQYNIMTLDPSVLNVKVLNGELIDSVYVYKDNDEIHVSDDSKILIDKFEYSVPFEVMLPCSIILGIGIGLVLINLS